MPDNRDRMQNRVDTILAIIEPRWEKTHKWAIAMVE